MPHCHGLPGRTGGKGMTMIEDFGAADGHAVQAVTLRAGAMTATAITWGARLTELHVPDRHGVTADVVLGFDTLAEYMATDHYFGATCGRYGNRIAKGAFVLAGQAVQVDCNERGNHLHGGAQGFDRKHWSIADHGPDHVTFAAVSEDGEMGFPGRCNLRAEYRLTATGLSITMTADTTQTTVMNMVNHSYFNLGGQGTILGHDLQINAGFYTPVDAALLATGEILSVTGTPFDFRTAKPIGRDIAALPGAGEGGGYDHNWCLAGAGMRDCATLSDPASGRRMTLRTSEPGVQVYTAGSLTDTVAAKAGRRMTRFGGLTFETQKFPGSPSHTHFPDCTLHPGQTYRHVMEFAFFTDGAPAGTFP